MLRTFQKTIDEKGESGQTWRGLEEWIIKAQPPIVIVENVFSAPWEKKIERFNKLGYQADFLRLDTKKYYIPHTRQRGYLFAIKKKPVSNSTAITEWKGVVQSLQRPASASLDDMMFTNDDERVLRGRVRVAAGRKSGTGETTGRTDWTKCEAIHHACRDDEDLGDRRPFTGWSESGLTSTIGISWTEWVDAQVHRIHDLMDINTLRFAQQFVDPTYKTMIWNLSQNADRDTTGRVGLSQCITPSGVPYVTSRVGPLVGEELLMLQGIPADDLLFTKEADSDLKDLAGNAMSTTVVGACMFAALLVGHQVVANGPKSKPVNGMSKLAHSLVPRALCPAPNDIEITRKEGAYKSVPLQLSSLLEGEISLVEILADASSSAKKCPSETADKALAACDLMECVECGLTSSRACAVPARKFEEHNFEAVPEDYKRISPASFRVKVLKALPMCLQLQGLGISQLKKVMTDEVKNKEDKALWNDWKQAFVETTLELGDTRNTDTDLPAEFRFTRLVRSHRWTAVYESSRHARLELRLEKNEAVWFLFAKSPPLRGALRDALVRPLARMRVGTESFTDGSWEVCLPFCERINLTITGKGQEVPSWRSRIGLRGEFEQETTFEVFEVAVADQPEGSLAASINGEYKMLPKCGGACGSMRKRINGKPGSRDMFFFLESGRRTSGDADAYIFSEANQRTNYGEYRDVAVTVDPEIVYRPDCSIVENHQGSEPKTVRAMLPGKWIATSGINLRSPKLALNPKVDAPMKNAHLEVSITKDGWKRCPEVVCCDLPLALSDPLIIECIKRGIESQPLSVNLKKSKRIFERILFVAARLPLPPAFSETFMSIPSDGIERRNGEELACHKSSPPKPEILWTVVRKSNRQMFIPMVDGKQAAIYEQLLKNRPASWNVQLKMLSQGRLQMHIACNAASLAHRALGLFPMGSFPRRLAIETLDCSESVFGWRIVDHVDKSSEATLTGFPKMGLTSNKKDLPAEQPPGFENRHPLRIEQLRSLAWMLSQEATNVPFMEEEIVEAVLPNLKWRAEARVQRPVLVRGGIVADEVGYGKTAITLGLIAAAKEVNGPPPKPPKELAEKLFTTDATLVIIPGHLMSQWPREIKKFMGSKVKILEIKTMVQFNSCTIKDLMNADIVLVNFTVLSGDKYFSRLARFAGAGGNGLPSGKTTNRHFNAVYEECLKGIEKRVQTIKSDGSAKIYEDIERDAEQYMESSTDLRLDGKKSVYKTVSEESTKATKTQAKNKKAAVAKAAATEIDPWGLKEKKVKSDYRNLRCPPLELMHWNRVVVDEFHVSRCSRLLIFLYRVFTDESSFWPPTVPYRKGRPWQSSHSCSWTPFELSLVSLWHSTSRTFQRCEWACWVAGSSPWNCRWTPWYECHQWKPC
jgi:site-specific DNA-cytosine methylase